MEKHMIYVLVLLIALQYSTVGDAANPKAIAFIAASCKTTTFPTLCNSGLSPYSGSILESRYQLVETAILVSLNNAKSAAAFVSQLVGAPGMKPNAVEDCVNSTVSGVASLTQSFQQFGQMAQLKGRIFEQRINNVEALISSAIRNANTCAGGFSDGSTFGGVNNDAVTNLMTNMAQAAKNALDLVNSFAVRQKDGTRMP